jgi:hypothetical protein
MPRLLSERSRSYAPQGGIILSPGRSAQRAVVVLAAPCMATCRVIGQESAPPMAG